VSAISDHAHTLLCVLCQGDGACLQNLHSCWLVSRNVIDIVAPNEMTLQEAPQLHKKAPYSARCCSFRVIVLASFCIHVTMSMHWIAAQHPCATALLACGCPGSPPVP
jgi:acyl-ACP thioesterase